MLGAPSKEAKLVLGAPSKEAELVLGAPREGRGWLATAGTQFHKLTLNAAFHAVWEIYSMLMRERWATPAAFLIHDNCRQHHAE
ncbi:MAG: hypothetical protein ACOYMG_05985 [Candidatus Methylumidiphilus sp.]